MSVKWRESVTSLLALVLLLLAGRPAAAHGAPAVENRVTLLCLDSLTLADIMDGELPNLLKFFSRGAWGLLNTNVAGANNLESAYLTLGAGARVHSPDGLPGLNAGDSLPEEPGDALEVYRRRTGYSATQGIVQTGLGALRMANTGLGYRVELGSIGQGLRAAGLETAVIGCADTEVRNRPVVNLLMDANGYVPYGYTGTRLLTRHARGPFGAWTDSAAVIEEAKKAWGKASVIAIEWADLYRAEKYAAFVLPEVGEALRHEALKRLDAFLGLFLSVLPREGTTVILLVPAPGTTTWTTGHRLTPVALVGPGVESGLLTSATTRRSGLVANIDIAATVLAAFNLPQPAAVLGRPVTVVPDPDPLTRLSAMERRAVANLNQRPFILRAYVVYLILVLVLAVWALWRHTAKASRWVDALLPAGATVPLSFLIQAVLPPQPLLVTALTTVGLTAFLVFVLKRRTQSSSTTLIIIALLTILVLAWDLALGQNLVASSLLGYCFVSGARYYGLGNEYMGILLGAVLSCAGYLCDRYRWSATTGTLLLLLLAVLGSFFLGAGSLGSNAGGTLAWVSGVGTACLGLWRSEPRFKEVAVSVLSAAAVLAFLAWFDWRFAPASSHIGQALNLAARSGPESLLDIAGRKLSMNLKLLRYSLWSRVLLMLLLALISLFFGPHRLRPQLARQRPFFTTCLRGSLTGTLVAFIANDSGVVAAATSLLFPVSLLILFALSRRNEENQQNQQELALERN